MRALVMEAILCRGLTAAEGEKSSGGRMELPSGELAELPADIPVQKRGEFIKPIFNES